jgi:hypothetical protein
MRLRTTRRLLGALTAAASMSAAATDTHCDVAALRGLGAPPDTLLACVRAVATRPGQVDGELLRAALGALVNASFTRPAADEPELARRLLAELQRRGALGPDDHETLRKILLQNGRLDEVAADRAAHPAAGEAAVPARLFLGQPPRAGEARYWRWDARGTALVEQSVDLAHGTHLVIDASPGCQFCAKAVMDIDRDPALMRLFDGALWITRPEQGLASAYWAHWNDAHPAHPMVLVLDAQGWDLPPQWSTPQFRFFLDGRVVVSLLGWTPTSRAALLQAGREQGLLPD